MTVNRFRACGLAARAKHADQAFEPRATVLAILLTGGTKKCQQRDIATATEMRADYRAAGGRRDERRVTMPLTGSFKELVQRHVADDPAYADALLCEGIDTMLAGAHLLPRRVDFEMLLELGLDDMVVGHHVDSAHVRRASRVA
jgi:hypothetical protein